MDCAIAVHVNNSMVVRAGHPIKLYLRILAGKFILYGTWDIQSVHGARPKGYYLFKTFHQKFAHHSANVNNQGKGIKDAWQKRKSLQRYLSHGCSSIWLVLSLMAKEKFELAYSLFQIRKYGIYTTFCQHNNTKFVIS